MFLKYKHPMCLGLTHLQIGELSLAQGLAETAFLNSIVVLWLPPERSVGGMFVLILLIKPGLNGAGDI